MTTLELGVLQGWNPMELVTPFCGPVGRSESRWREGIGNQVPVLAAEAMGSAFLDAMLRAKLRVSFQLRAEPVWVRRGVRGVQAMLAVDVPRVGP